MQQGHNIPIQITDSRTLPKKTFAYLEPGGNGAADAQIMPWPLL